MSSELALTISASLIVTTATALFSKKMSISLIMLFYSSITLGVIFTLYGSVLVGLLHIVTFAGAIPVILLTVIMMTGESNLEIGANRLTIILLTLTLLTVAIASYSLFSYLPIKQSSSLPLSLTQFIWQFRPWDLLIIVMIFASSMIVVVNLLSKEK